MRGLFVTGTDTEVGKSVVAACICAALAARGERVAAFKPVVTGLDEEPGEFGRDHELLAAAASAGQRPRMSRRTRFGPPVSPHLAAELAGDHDRAARAGGRRRRARTREGLLVCEGVGGLMVPITPGYLVRDLAVDLALPVVIAARPGLGTINHTLLTLEAAPRRRADGRRRGHDAVAGRAERRWSARTATRSPASATSSVTGLPRTTPDRLAEAGASLPLDDWL